MNPKHYFITVIIISVILSLFPSLPIDAQTSIPTYTIDEIVSLYTKASSDYYNSNIDYRVDILNNRNALNDFKWKSDIDLSLPYNKAIESVIQSDGSVRFIERNYLSPNAQLNVSKSLKNFGGTLSASYSISNYTDFVNNTRQYGLNWVNLQYNRNFLAFNELRYSFKKLTISSEESRLSHLQSNERLAKDFVSTAITQYISLMQAKEVSLNITKLTNLLHQQQELIKFGKALPADTLKLLQLIEQFDINKNKTDAYNFQYSARLHYELGINNDYKLNLNDDGITLNLDTMLLSDRYLEFSLNKNYRSQFFDAQAELARAKHGSGFSISLTAGLGINGKSDSHFEDVFRNAPSNKQNVGISASIPITGWNTYRNTREIAELNLQKLARTSHDRQFEARLWAQAILNNYVHSKALIGLAKRVVSNSYQLEDVELSKIKNGKTGYNDLYQIYLDRQNADEDLYRAIRDLYVLKYELREMTLYDFEKNIPLDQ